MDNEAWDWSDELHEGKREYAALSDSEENTARLIVNSAVKVHKALGPGLLEHVYEVCLAYELEKAGCKVQRQVEMPVVYDGMEFPQAYRVDLLVNDCVICELKAIEQLQPVHTAQLLSYLRLSKRRLGFLLNFNAALMKDGIRRKVIE